MADLLEDLKKKALVKILREEDARAIKIMSSPLKAMAEAIGLKKAKARLPSAHEALYDFRLWSFFESESDYYHRIGEIRSFAQHAVLDLDSYDSFMQILCSELESNDIRHKEDLLQSFRGYNLLAKDFKST